VEQSRAGVNSSAVQQAEKRARRQVPGKELLCAAAERDAVQHVLLTTGPVRTAAPEHPKS